MLGKEGEPVSVTTVVREEVLERCVFHMTSEKLQKL